MKQTKLVFIFSVWCTMGWGQVQITPTVLAAASGYYGTCNSLNVSYTIGEMTAIETAGSTNTVHITEGFLQPVTPTAEQLAYYPVCLTAITDIKALAFDFDLFPNPTAQTCQVRFVAPEYGNALFTITDLTDRQLVLIKSACAEGPANRQLDVSNLSSGAYLLNLKFTGHAGINYQSVKQFIIIN